jgi:sulfate transport system substrate-binding protein
VRHSFPTRRSSDLSNPAILKKYSKTFKPLQLFTVNEVFGSFAEAQKVHFNDGGNFDKLYTVK